MTSMTVELQLGCELTVPAAEAGDGRRVVPWRAYPAVPDRRARLFAEHWLQLARVRQLHRRHSCVACHEAALRAVGLSVRPFGA